MLKIRLQRTGRRNQPQFRAIVTDARQGPKSGRFIEIVGSYEPKAGKVTLDAERIKYWLSVGAQASGTMHNFMVDQKIVDGPKRNVLPKKTPIKKEVEETEEAPAPAAKEEEAPAAEAEEAPAEETPAEEPAAEEAPAEEEKKEEETPAE